MSFLRKFFTKSTAAARGLVVAGAGISTFLSRPKYSYHILYNMNMPNNLMFWWPMSSIGEYCTNENDAIKQFDKEIRENPTGVYQLVKYKAIREHYIGRVIGIDNTTKEVIRKHPPS
jgi:hypothetical protein